jgi:hypothetical protein
VDSAYVPTTRPCGYSPDLRFRTLAGNVELGSGSCGVTLDGGLVCWGVVNREGRRQILHPRRAR